jgi:hypothetical protein
LFGAFTVAKQEFWIKNEANQWVTSTAEQALSFAPRNHESNPHECAYALGCFVLRKTAPSLQPARRSA